MLAARSTRASVERLVKDGRASVSPSRSQAVITLQASEKDLHLLECL
jgi:hypothetical protein